MRRMVGSWAALLASCLHLTQGVDLISAYDEIMSYRMNQYEKVLFFYVEVIVPARKQGPISAVVNLGNPI